MKVNISLILVSLLNEVARHEIQSCDDIVPMTFHSNSISNPIYRYRITHLWWALEFIMKLS